MAKVIQNEGENNYGITCPACECGHGLKGWTFNGDMDKPTFNPSLLVRGALKPGQDGSGVCHSFIRDGNIEYLADCTHEYAGKTVELPEWGDYDSPVKVVA